ncbi:hypothetical protein [Brucella sp.]|uniref:hypothetical protein n=1 Tax=Brucella sp. TaxID=52132 RepID=UPI0028AEA0ED|nr:hypothetical protein [Brucella sp.]
MKSSDFYQGSAIEDPMIVMRMIAMGRNIFWKGRVYSNAFMRGQRIQTIISHTEKGAFSFAHERNPK